MESLLERVSVSGGEYLALGRAFAMVFVTLRTFQGIAIKCTP